jgi:hypothetical protein
LSGAAKVQGYTRGGECWRWYARGVARHCRPQGANGIERHCRAHAATLFGRRGPDRAAQGPWGGVLTATTARPRAAVSGTWTRRSISLGLQLPERLLTAGPTKTTSVIDAITRRAKLEAGLPVLILMIPNSPILQSCALPDYNCGATLIPRKTVRTRFFFIEFAFLRGR